MTETQTVDLATWLGQIWDEEERLAKECEEVYPSPWELSDRGWMAKVQADKPGFRIVAELEQHPAIDGWLGDRLAHVAYHDPASVLARIAADRKILAECMKILAVDWWEYSDAPDLAEFVIRQKAGEYADRPDYPLAVERQGVEQG